jgi:hypothetical protein
MSDYYNNYSTASGYRDGFDRFADPFNGGFEESKTELEAIPADHTTKTCTASDGDEVELVFAPVDMTEMDVSMESKPEASRKLYPGHPKNGEEVATNPSKKKGSRKDGDNDLREMPDAGEWGQISKKELLVVATLLITIIVAVIAMVVVFVVVGRDDTGTSTSMTIKPDPTPTPAVDYVPLGSQEKLDLLRALIASKPNAAECLDILPESAGVLEGKSVNDTADAIVRAASWLVHEDELSIPGQLLDRFALATIFYANGGESWNNSNGWLSNKAVCDGWYGIFCYSNSDRIEELDLSMNNLQGQIPQALSLLVGMRVLWLNGNALTGEIPGGEFVGPMLLILYIQGNQLTGTIPTSLQDNGILRKLCCAGLATPAAAITPISHKAYFQARSFSRTTTSQEAGQKLFVLLAPIANVPSISLL